MPSDYIQETLFPTNSDKKTLIVTTDSIGRDWIICPSCGKKTPGWGGGYGKRGNPSGFCRWCNKEWRR